MSEFLPAYEKTLLNEGGYVLHDVKDDRGGMTYAGISRRFWPNWRGWVDVDAGSVPEAQDVRAFYRAKFWDPLRLSEISEQEIAETLYDFAVNAGTGIAVKLAQIVVGTTPDGRIGPKTLAAINATDPRTFVLRYALAKVARYREIIARDKTQLKFINGWLSRVLKGVA